MSEENAGLEIAVMFMRPLYLALVALLPVLCLEEMRAEKLVTRSTLEVRPLQLARGGEWSGNAICYGPHREGQRPGGLGPSKEQLKEDLEIIAKHWPLFRIYGSTEFAAEMLEVMREEEIPLQVMLGAWIQPESHKVGDLEELNQSARQANMSQVQKVIELANQYDEFVIAISIGNETQVEWSSHKVPAEQLVKYLREARAGTTVPVTTADDFMFWSDASSRPIADEVDFITTHMHPVWHGQEAGNALAFVQEKYELVIQAHPDSVIVIGETGWATHKNATGREAKYVRGKMGEYEQLIACQQIIEWAKERQVPTFIFSAFDEPWKGADHPNEVEKHWGQFRLDRTPKKVMSVFRIKKTVSENGN